MVSSPLCADEGGKHTVTVDDHFTLGIFNEIAISAPAKGVAYTEARWSESANNRKNDLWFAPFSGEGPRRLTFDRAGYDTLRWSPDGKSLYFATSTKRAGESTPPFDGTRQVWRLALDGGEPLAITRVDGGIHAFELCADGKSLIYTTSASEDHGDWQKLRSEYSKIRYGTRKHERTSFHKLDLSSWRATLVTKFAGAVDNFKISPDGKRIAAITSTDGAVITMEGQSKVTFIDVASGKATELPDEPWRKQLISPYGRLSEPAWSADSKALAFAIGFDAYPSETMVVTWNDENQPSVRKLPRPGDMSLHASVDSGGSPQWRGDSHDLYYLGEDHARIRIYCAKNATSDSPTVEPVTEGDVVVEAYAWDSQGNGLAAVIAKPTQMADLYHRTGAEWKQVTDIHAHVRDWALPTLSVVKWKGQNDVPVEGILELPPGYKQGKPLPLVVNIHGGPTSAVSYGMIYGFTGSTLFAGQGYAFLSPNYRGSTGYGDKFLTDLVGHENDVDVEDIIKGIDHLVAEGTVDKDRVAIAGWSNGGYLTNCVIAKSDRFKAASCGAGIIDQTMEWGTNDEPAYPLIFSGGPPWSHADAYRRASPIFNYGNVKTPTLFHVGEFDVRCPKGQSEMAYRALKEYLKVDSELLVYPGEGHGLSRYGSRKAKLAWELAWFDHYLKGLAKP